MDMLRPSFRNTASALSLCLAFALLVFAAPALGQSDLSWEIVEAWRPNALEPGIERLASQGYTVQAVVLESNEPTVLMVREGFRQAPRLASYRVLASGQAGEVEKLAGEGWAFHRAGTTFRGEAVVVLSRGAPGQASGTALRSLELPAKPTDGSALERLYADGFTVVAALGGGRVDWLLFERRAGSADREVRLIAAQGTQGMTPQLDSLAREGLVADAVWSRGAGGFSLTGPKELVAVLSRPRLAAGERPRPVAHTRLEVGQQPSLDGTLVSVARYGREQVFAVRAARESSYEARTFPLPITGADGKPPTAWERTAALREHLQNFAGNAVDHAWFERDGAQPTALVLIKSNRRPVSTPARAAAERRGPGGSVPTPTGAQSLPADGGEPAAAWRTQYEAVARLDVKRAKALWTGETLARWEENVKRFRAPLGMGFSEKELFESRAEDLATDPVVLGGWQKADEALVRIEATHEGSRAVSDVTLRRESGVWKVAAESSWRALD